LFSIPKAHTDIRRQYAALYLERLGLVPEVTVEAQGTRYLSHIKITLIRHAVDLNADLEDGTFRRVRVSLIDALLELDDVETSRCLNLLSIPLLHNSARVPGLAVLHELRRPLLFL
jgi:hypothetical protein